MWFLALGYLKKYWYYLLIAGALFGLYRFIYSRGYNHCISQLQKKTLEEVVRRENETSKENDKNTKIIHKINVVRQNKPVDDDRDSCLLSNDPLVTQCIK